MTGNSVPSLADYVASRPDRAHKTAFFETLPADIQAEIIEAWKSGVRMTPIVEWLHRKGYDKASKSNINGYMSAHYGTGHE